MKNRLLRWCINWWADEETPTWLRSASDCDSKLAEYEEALDSLGRLLREDASDWSEREMGATDSLQPQSLILQHEESAVTRFRIATAAVLVASFAAMVLLWKAELLSHPAKRLPASEQIVAADVRQISAGLNSIIGVANKSLSELGVSVSTVPEFAGDAVGATSGDVKAICGSAKVQFESVSRSYGLALALIEESVRGQLGGIDIRKN